MCQRTTKPIISLMRPANTLIRLRIRAVWSESSLIACAFYSLGDINENPCCTTWMYRLIWVFASYTGLIHYEKTPIQLYRKFHLQKLRKKYEGVSINNQPIPFWVKFWVGELKRGRTSLEDEARSGRHMDATDEEMCEKIRDLVYSDRRIQVEEIAQALGISHGSVSTILHDRLGTRKLTAVGSPNP